MNLIFNYSQISSMIAIIRIILTIRVISFQDHQTHFPKQKLLSINQIKKNKILIIKVTKVNVIVIKKKYKIYQLKAFNWMIKKKRIHKD
jgi:hypothetical protein